MVDIWGIFFDTGNIDSKNPFRERIGLNDREIITTTLESLVLSVCLEFWFIWQEGSFPRTGLVQLQTKEELRKRFGQNLGDKCFDTLKWYKENRGRANDA
jgi:hypothetical protein